MQSFRAGSKALHEALIAHDQPTVKLTAVQKQASKLFCAGNFYTLKKVFNEVKKDPVKLANFQAGLISAAKFMNASGEGEAALRGIKSLRAQFPDSETGLSEDIQREIFCPPLHHSHCTIKGWIDKGVAAERLSVIPQDQVEILIDYFLRNRQERSLISLYKALAHDRPMLTRYQAAMSETQIAQLCVWMDGTRDYHDMIKDILNDRAICLDCPIANVFDSTAAAVLKNCEAQYSWDCGIYLFIRIDDLSGHHLSQDTVESAVKIAVKFKADDLPKRLEETLSRLKLIYPDNFKLVLATATDLGYKIG